MGYTCFRAFGPWALLGGKVDTTLSHKKGRKGPRGTLLGRKEDFMQTLRRHSVITSFTFMREMSR